MLRNIVMTRGEFMKIGKNIKRFRTRKNWSLQMLSEESGIPASTLSDLETDKYLPNVEKAKKLADALGVTTDDLLEEEKLTKIGG
ncbi:TPA: helix-turn-helix transcriptional regulator [Listeria monocytogenes]|uniref:helix-turn-helix domain-containing protein n=1 Tax=Listeria monocytogenes TaxID=1639 RepID=UPI00098734AE|nr:helix-turn-helix transcriptional regulator [Listeria monocytogenes]EAG2930013.1 XRE family transcriptional regulator [Listeria monocytogenes]EDN7371489.1 helix-turn-helix domain-containing protein [Listeria monocytogenes]EDN7434644.1 helix-turn-helix domain-containing protein [Listeria monocytogenes]EDN7461596.1 helix-turn-helix domain-containing protein [Listeria monocytogenes]EDN9152355.1 helix-turn-helix transcriptional regulator [Listeria monocytogenes]